MERYFIFMNKKIQQHGDYQRERGRKEIEEDKWGQMVMEGDLTWGGEYTVHHTDDVL